MQSKDPVFSTNKRMHVSIETGEDNFGCVTFVSVGATNAPWNSSGGGGEARFVLEREGAINLESECGVVILGV